jgi:hypothetical protein
MTPIAANSSVCTNSFQFKKSNPEIKKIKLKKY